MKRRGSGFVYITVAFTTGLMGVCPVSAQPLGPQMPPPETIVCGFYGQITNERGQPIPGACVFYRAASWSEQIQVRGGETNEAGIYVVKNLSPGQTYYVTVWAAGYKPAEIEGVVPQVEQPQVVNVQLKPGGQMFVGHVIDEETGKPLPPAQVFLGQALHNPLTRWRGFLGFNRLSTRCAQDGGYKLPCPEPGRYYLVAYAEGYDQAEVVCLAEPDVPAIMVPVLRMRRSHFGVLHLTVLAPDGQTPVEGAKIFLDTGPLPGEGRGVTTAADGTAVLEQVNVNWPAVHFLTVWRQGYALTVVDGVCVTEGQPTSLQVRMNSGVTLTGQLLDQQGQPASDRVVTVRPIALHISGRRFWPIGSYEPLFLKAETDKEGRFEILHLAPGQWGVSVSGKENKEVITTDLRVIIVEASEKEISVELREIP